MGKGLSVAEFVAQTTEEQRNEIYNASAAGNTEKVRQLASNIGNNRGSAPAGNAVNGGARVTVLNPDSSAFAANAKDRYNETQRGWYKAKEESYQNADNSAHAQKEKDSYVTDNILYHQWEQQQKGLKADSSAHAQAEKDDEAEKNPLFHQWKTAFDRQQEEKSTRNQVKIDKLQKELDELDANSAYITTNDQYDEYQNKRKGIVDEMVSLGGDGKGSGERALSNAWDKTKDFFKGTGSRTTEGLNSVQIIEYNKLLSELDELNQEAAYSSTTAASDEYERRRKDILTQLHTLDAQAGREARTYDSRERTGAFFKSWGTGTGASYTNAAGNINEITTSAQGVEREIAELETQVARAQTAYDEAVQQYGEAGATFEKNLLVEAQQRLEAKKAQYAGMEKERAYDTKAQAVSQKLYDTADKLLTQSEQEMAKAKYGASGLGSFALDVAKTGLDVAADTALSYLGAPGLANMAVRVYGSEAQQARLQGDNAQTAAAKGLKSALIEVATEKIAGPFEKAYGKTALSSTINKAVDKLNASGLIKWAADTMGEGFEEGMSDVLNIMADHMMGWDSGENSVWGDIAADKDEIMYDMLLGAFVGAFGATGNAIGTRANTSPTAQAQPQVQQTTPVQSEATQQVEPVAQQEAVEQTAPVQTAPQTENSAVGVIEAMLSQGSISNSTAEKVVSSPTLADAFYEVTGIALEGTKAQRRAAVKAAAANNAPSQLNIDNGNARAYNNTNDNSANNIGGMTDVAGRSVEADSGRVSGVYRTGDSGYSGRREFGRTGVGSGLVLLSPQARDTLAKRGVAVVETQDVSNDKPAFSAALEAARNSDAVNGWAVTPKSVADLEKSGAKLIMAANGSTGLAITPDGDIEAVFANKAAGAPKGATKTTIPQAIANGGTKLDCYGAGLVKLYSQYGFVPVARVKFNPEYANPGWDTSKGTPDIFFMMHNGDSADTVIEKMGKYNVLTPEELNALPVMDYDEAYSYRDGLLANRTASSTQATQPTGDISTPPTAQNVKQGASDALNSAVDYNSRGTQAEAPSQAQGSAQKALTEYENLANTTVTHNGKTYEVGDFLAAVDACNNMFAHANFNTVSQSLGLPRSKAQQLLKSALGMAEVEMSKNGDLSTTPSRGAQTHDMLCQAAEEEATSNATAQKNTAPTQETENSDSLIQRVKKLLSGASTAEKRSGAISNMDFGETSAAIESGMVSRDELPFATVSKTTPQVLIDNARAQNLPIIMDYDTVYLSAKKSGDLKGHYHNLGSKVMEEIPNALENPVLMVRLKNGRINEIVQLNDKKGNPVLVSLELSAIKNLGGSFNAYNLVVTAFGAKSNYINNLVSNPDNLVLINNLPGATSQVNPQRNELPGVVNEATSGSTKPGTPQSGITGDVSGISIPTAPQIVKQNFEGEGASAKRTKNGQYIMDGYADGATRERGVSKNVRTDTAMEQELRESFNQSPEMYTQLTNKETLAKAKEIYAKGYEHARSEVERAIGKGKEGYKIAPEIVPLAKMVSNELTRRGEVETARSIMADIALESTAAGQFNQAQRIMRNSDPVTALMSMEKLVDEVNAEFQKHNPKSEWKAELTEAEKQQILSTDFTEDGAWKNIYNSIADRIGKEMPSTMHEKITELRRMNMLLRPRTMIKNVASNIPMIGLRKGAETLSIGIQKALVETGLMDESQRTRGWASDEQRQLAKNYYEANKADINGQSNKWDFKSMLREHKTVFKGGAIEKAVNKMTGAEVDSFAEALRKTTYNLLERGDAPFVKSAFVDSLAQYCAAKGITSAENITPEAVQFATANAMEATFKNANIIAKSLNTIKREHPAFGTAIDILMPFTTTPANILQLTLDYSPAGFVKLATNADIASKIDAFSKASMGTALMLLGYAARNMGWITGGEDDDKDKAALDRATGQGTYSIGGKVSYDWAQPVGSLLAIGAEISDAVKGQESWGSAFLNALYTGGDSILNTSLFQNILSVLKGKGTSASEQIIDAIMNGGITQLIPGLAGDIAKIIDENVRSTYTGGNAFQNVGAKALAMIPGMSKMLPESVNVKGETNTRGNAVERVLNTLINPTNITRGERNAVDDELYRLMDTTGSKTFLPSVSPYKVEYGNDEYTMTGKEREVFQKVQGQTYYELANSLLDSEIYKALSDDEKAATLNAIRDYSLSEAKRQFLEGRNAEYSSSTDGVSDLPDSANYFAAKQALTAAGKDGATETTYNALDTALDYWNELSQPSQEKLRGSQLNVDALRYADTMGIGSQEWYNTKKAIGESAKTHGKTDVATAIAVYNSMGGKSDKEILNAIRSQLMPDAGGQQNTTVRRIEAYNTIAGENANLNKWLNLVAELHDADENGSISKADVYAAWSNSGLGEKDTYAGITRDDFYNIVKTNKSYAKDEKYATQIDNAYAEIDPAQEKTKYQLAGSVTDFTNSGNTQEQTRGAVQYTSPIDFLLANTPYK